MNDMFGYYILEGKTPVRVDDVLEWGRWFETADRNVLKTKFPNGIVISTVFLGLPHSPNGSLFETMVFGSEIDYCRRYQTWDEAEKGHEETVDLILDEMCEEVKYQKILKDLGLITYNSKGEESEEDNKGGL